MVAERTDAKTPRLAFQGLLGLSLLLFAAELLLVLVAIAANFINSDGYAGTNLSSDAQFFAVALSPLLGLASLGLIVGGALGVWRVPKEHRRPYARGLIIGAVLLFASGFGLVLGVSLLGGGIVPH